MRKALHELATGYAAATGCACEAEEGSCQAVQIGRASCRERV